LPKRVFNKSFAILSLLKNINNLSNKTMNNLSEERMQEIEETKKAVKKLNVDAVAQLLTDMQTDNHKIKTEQVSLKPIILKVTQDVTALRAEINTLKAMGARGNMGGTGSTVHKQGE
jgi:hypothetical protein